MLTFLEYVQKIDEDIAFQRGKDQDYTNDPNSLLVFSEKDPDEYELRGKTHGAMSHAIKHLVEFDKPFVDNIVSQARTLLEQFVSRHPQCFCKIWIEGKGFSSKSGIDAIRSANAGEILNTFDLINDKNEMKKGFLKVENQLKKLALQMEERYKNIIEDKIAKAVSLNKMPFDRIKKAIKTFPVITFKVSQNNKTKDVWLDFSDSSIIIGSIEGTEKVNTMFQFTGLSGGDKKATIKAFYTKRLSPINPDVDKALSGF